jgi:cell division protein ZapA
MADSANLVHVEIFGQTYAVRAGADAAYVEQLGRYVDDQMQQVARTSGAVDSVRIAVLAALNIADEYFRLKNGGSSADSDLDARAKRLAETLDQALLGPQ